MQRFLLLAGLVLIALALAWPWLSKLPFGRLPGDIRIVRDGFTVYVPLATCLLVSLLLSLLFWLFRR